MVVWAYAAMCLIYGTTFLAIRVGDEAGMPPFLFAALRFAAAGLVMLFIMYLRNLYLRNRGDLGNRADSRHTTSFPDSWRAYGSLLSLGFFTTTSVFAIVYYVEQYVPSGYAALMAATMPFLVMLLGRLRGKQLITGMQYVGLCIGFLGVLAIAWPGLKSGVPHWITMTLVLLIAQVMAAIGAVQSGRVLAQGISPFVVNGFQVVFGSIGLFILAAVTGGMSLQAVHPVGAAVESLLYLTILGTMVASTLFYLVIKRAGALLASTWTYVSPVIAVVAGHLMLGEPVYTWTVVGTAGILLGLVVLNYRGLRAAIRPPAKAEPVQAL